MRLLVPLLAMLAACDVAADADVDPDAEPRPDPPAEGFFPLPTELEPEGDAFYIAMIPDTQVYAERFPETFERHFRWLAVWKDYYDIRFVSHVGDIIQHSNRPQEITNALAAFDWLEDVDMPHGISAGSHDFSHDGRGFDDREHDNSCSPFGNIDCQLVEYVENWGPQHYEGRSWFVGASPSGFSNAQLIEAGGMELLFLHLPQDTPRAEVDWAHEVLDAHPGTLAHLTTHRYLFDYRLTQQLPPPMNLLPAGRFNALTYLFGGQSLVFDSGLAADDLFAELVAAHPNIWGVHCGHVDAEFTQTSVNEAGLPVYETLVDFQDMADGGGGWLRLLRFEPAHNRIEAYTFSTETGELRENGAGFDHSIDIVDYYKGLALDTLSAFGVDEEEVDQLLEDIQPGGPRRQEYFDALYADGDRDSSFVMEVDFQAYIEASK